MKKRTLFLYLAALSFGVGSVNAAPVHRPKATNPDLEVKGISLPAPDCNLSDAEVGAWIVNNGAPVDGILAWYTTGNSDTVKQEFRERIGEDEELEIVFDQVLSLLQEEATVISVGVSLLPESTQKEVVLSNNSMLGGTRNYTPVEVPFTCVAADGDFFAKGIGWAYEPVDRTVSHDFSTSARPPLYTRCFILEPGQYRVDMTYLAGLRVSSVDPVVGTITVIYKDPFAVRMGKPGTDVDFWEEVHQDEGFTAGKIAEGSFFLSVEEKDTVELAFVPNFSPNYKDEEYYFEGSILGFRSLSIRPLEDGDMGISRVESSLPHVSTLEQANAQHHFSTIVQNKGAQAGHAYLSFYSAADPDRVFGTSDTVEISSDGQYTFETDILIDGLGLAQDDAVAIRVHIKDGVDGYAENDIHRYPISISDSVMAYDMQTEAILDAAYIPTVGKINGTISFGPVYSVKTADTLTSITLGLDKSLGGYSPIGFTIHKWNAKTGSKEYVVVEKSFARPEEAGFYAFSLESPIILEPGDYFLEVHQTSSVYIGLITDENDEHGYNYVTSPSTGKVNKQTKIGFAVARLNFGHTDKPIKEKDAAVIAISKPAASGKFSRNEVIEAEIANQGSSSVEVKVVCSVNGEKQDKTVAMIPFSRNTVSFTADLSKAGDYKIEVSVELANDIDPTNDKKEKTVQSLGDPDPYVMDFEYCEDFAITGLLPWIGLDVDTCPTILISGYDIPYAGEKMSFMAFDPTLVSGFENFVSVPQGRKVGLALAANANFGRNDDWIISSKLKLPASGSQLTFWVRGLQSSEEELYNVLISKTNAQPSSFEPIMSTAKATGPWQEVTVDLGKFNGQAVHVAIQYVSEDGFGLLLDDIRVGKKAGTESLSDFAADFTLYPNPAGERITIHSGGLNMTRVEILNLYGALVYDTGRIEDESLSLNTTQWASGIYFARVSTAEGTHIMKFVVR